MEILERDDMGFDDEEGLVIDPSVDPTTPHNPLDDLFAEVDRELAKRRGMWAESEARLTEGDSMWSSISRVKFS